MNYWNWSQKESMSNLALFPRLWLINDQSNAVGSRRRHASKRRRLTSVKPANLPKETTLDLSKLTQFACPINHLNSWFRYYICSIFVVVCAEWISHSENCDSTPLLIGYLSRLCEGGPIVYMSKTYHHSQWRFLGYILDIETLYGRCRYTHKVS